MGQIPSLPRETDFELDPEACLPKRKTKGDTVPIIEHKLLALLDHAWQDSFTIMSDYAQRNMELVAMAASLQLITTRVNRDVFSRNWQITAKGHRWLNEAKETT